MTWYAAHLVFYVKLKGKRQKRFPVWENIVLISARTLDEAWQKSEKRALDDPCMHEDESFTWDGVPAKFVYGGIRKLTRCMDEHHRPGNGTEVSYVEMELDSEEAIRKLVAMKPVSVEIVDACSAEVDERAERKQLTRHTVAS